MLTLRSLWDTNTTFYQLKKKFDHYSFLGYFWGQKSKLQNDRVHAACKLLISLSGNYSNIPKKYPANFLLLFEKLSVNSFFNKILSSLKEEKSFINFEELCWFKGIPKINQIFFRWNNDPSQNYRAAKHKFHGLNDFFTHKSGERLYCDSMVQKIKDYFGSIPYKLVVS